MSELVSRSSADSPFTPPTKNEKRNIDIHIYTYTYMYIIPYYIIITMYYIIALYHTLLASYDYYYYY